MSTDTASAIFDLARISVQIGEIESVNGWTIVGMGMFVVLFCLIIISFTVALLPRILEVVNKILPENSDEKHKSSAQKASSSPVEAVAAAVAIAYHNYHNAGK
jgi:Na+-transporting methylmalonyl-CoA/oxaloacetate decarboxylase gamma subunit